MEQTQTRRTSDAVYNSIRATGYITGKRWEVFEYIWNNGPCTQTQARRDLGNPGDHSNSGITTRFSELVRMGVIEIVDHILDPVHGRHEVDAYDITGRMPVRLAETTWKTTDYVVYDKGKGVKKVFKTVEAATQFCDANACEGVAKRKSVEEWVQPPSA